MKQLLVPILHLFPCVSTVQNAFAIMSNPLFQALFDIVESLRMQQQQQRKRSRDGNADSRTTRQRVTGAQIPDVWKNHGAGCSRHRTAINKAACMRRWTNGACDFTSSSRGLRWPGTKTSEASY